MNQCPCTESNQCSSIDCVLLMEFSSWSKDWRYKGLIQTLQSKWSVMIVFQPWERYWSGACDTPICFLFWFGASRFHYPTVNWVHCEESTPWLTANWRWSGCGVNGPWRKHRGHTKGSITVQSPIIPKGSQIWWKLKKVKITRRKQMWQYHPLHHEDCFLHIVAALLSMMNEIDVIVWLRR